MGVLLYISFGANAKKMMTWQFDTAKIYMSGYCVSTEYSSKTLLHPPPPLNCLNFSTQKICYFYKIKLYFLLVVGTKKFLKS